MSLEKQDQFNYLTDLDLKANRDYSLNRLKKLYLAELKEDLYDPSIFDLAVLDSLEVLRMNFVSKKEILE